jgi:beta-1,4-mannosyltransferase
MDKTSLNELVKDGKNGLIFANALELAQQIETLLMSFPSSRGPLNNLRTSLIEASSHPSPISTVPNDEDHWEWNSWNDNWNKVVRPLASKDTNHGDWLM